MKPFCTADILARRNTIIREALGLDYEAFARSRLSFDYEALMASVGHSLQEVQRIQSEVGVGRTPLLELRNITGLCREFAPAGKGARILLKDEAANPSGSFKARRAALAVHEALQRGYQGVVAATSGNYGAAVASQAAMRNLNCIVIQEAFGVNPHIRSVADGYAAEGWLAVAPSTFHRVKPGVELGYSQDDVAAGMALKTAAEALPAPGVLQDIQAAIGHAGQAGKVGIVGYCWGGLLT